MGDFARTGRVLGPPSSGVRARKVDDMDLASNDRLTLSSFGDGLTVAVIGASGGIGGGFVELLGECPAVDTIVRLSRTDKSSSSADTPWLPIDLGDEDSIADAAASIDETFGRLHLVIVATGILHDRDGLQPEKSWRALGADAMEKAYRINAVGPALVAKHFLPLLAADRKTAFAALSARVGSIGDNGLGGWFAYRASKAALNMLIKTLSIELARRNPGALCVGLHPGTVDTSLSRPFQRGVPEGNLFTPRQSAHCLLNVLNGLSNTHSGQVFAWDGQPIPE